MRAAANGASAGHATILLAEDNKVNQMLAVRTLEKGGYHVWSPNNGVEAVQIALEQPLDLILMDIQMPEMDGFQATAKIRAWQAAKAKRPIPVIAMTAHALKGDRERCLDGGMTDYISKPVRPADLLDHGGASRKRRLEAAAGPITRTGPYAILLCHITRDLHADLAESFVRIRLWIIRDRVGVHEIFADVFERFDLLLPGLGEIGFPARAGRDAAEHAARDRDPC